MTQSSSTTSRHRLLAALAALVASPSTAAAAEGDARSGTPLAVAVLPHDLSPWGMFLTANLVVQAVLVGLLFASVTTWTVWLAKSIELLAAKRRAREAVRLLGEIGSLNEAVERFFDRTGPTAALVAAAATETRLSRGLPGDGLKERVASRLERIEAASRQRIARGTGVLATIGATAPFVGLFGTVWGIMNSFIGISRAQTTNLAIVAPGIAEALLATAIGLVAAIPAVVIYNLFARSIASYRMVLADSSAELMRLVSRDNDRLASGAAAPERFAKAAE
ncbi:MAG: tonB-system energizer ExbB [Rhodospirillales bacterium]|nr:tonB-system energizer ExbB [Rhodospirillales bacterium]